MRGPPCAWRSVHRNAVAVREPVLTHPLATKREGKGRRWLSQEHVHRAMDDAPEDTKQQRDASLIRLSDVATVELGEEEGDVNARHSQDQAIYISVWPLPGANEMAIGDKLYTLLDEINPTLPEGVEIKIGYDGTLYMRSALKEIFITGG